MADDTPAPERMDALREALDAAKLAPPAPGSEHDGSGLLDLPCSFLLRNDTGNAKCFVRRFGAD